jgi:tRNA (pseudouridine54-N1)-methyltransferase
MREFIYFSRYAHTSGNFKDLMRAGRLDIVCHTIIASFFTSHNIRPNVKLHLIFYGPPDPPKHLEITSSLAMRDFLSKKDVGGLIKRMLYKYKKGQKVECFPGCEIEKKSLLSLVNELKEEGKQVFLMDRKGKDIQEVSFTNPVFIIGDQEGIPKDEKKRIFRMGERVSLGKETYFASHSIVILHYLLDRMPNM